MSATGVPRISTRSQKVALSGVGEGTATAREATCEEYFGGVHESCTCY
jgi:hypothetical protein